MPVVFNPRYIVCDCSPVLPIVNLPPDTIRVKVRQRWNRTALVYVKTPDGVTRHNVQFTADEKNWEQLPASARNSEASRLKPTA